MSFLDSLPTDTKDPAYGKALLAAISSSNYVMSWSAVTSTAAGHTATFQVSTDALKIEGVRINVSATLEQQVADMLGALLLTPKLADLAFLQSEVTILPSPQPISSSVAAMLAHSKCVDALVAGRSGLTRTVGKDWCIANALLSHPGKACNYGWLFNGTFGGGKWGAAVTPPLRAVQDMGFFHDPTHIDYSQTCCLVRRDCVVDGTARDVAEVLQDPELAPLASHEGALRLLRQPGVAVVACAAPLASSGKHIPGAPMSGGVCPTPQPPSKADLTWAWALGGAVVAAGVTSPLWWPWMKRRMRRA